MKTFLQITLLLSLTLASFFAPAIQACDIEDTDCIVVSSAPEIGIGSAALGIALLTGLVALVSERRRK